MRQIFSNNNATITATTTSSSTILTIHNPTTHASYSTTIQSITELSDARLASQFYSVQALLEYIEQNGHCVRVEYDRGVIVILRR